jgi:thiamine pyrophosphokinase
LFRRTVIIANGELRNLEAARAVIQAGDHLIAADGGLHHFRDLKLTPHVLIGDLDSTSADEVNALVSAGTHIIQHPNRKDQTDLELALEWASHNGADDILILGALGARWDQTLANLLLPALPAWGAARIRLIDGNQEISLLRAPGSLTLPGEPGDTLSLIPVGGDVHGVTTHGLEYGLTQGRLRFGSTIGISNVLTLTKATVSAQEGLLVCVLIRQRNPGNP